MPILYSVVARGITVLAKYASCPGNFSEVTEQIIAKIPPDDSKLTYSHGSFLFHYICEDRIIYMCITDDVKRNIIVISVCKKLIPNTIHRNLRDQEPSCTWEKSNEDSRPAMVPGPKPLLPTL
jgi:hypothetical protein